MRMQIALIAHTSHQHRHSPIFRTHTAIHTLIHTAPISLKRIQQSLIKRPIQQHNLALQQPQFTHAVQRLHPIHNHQRACHLSAHRATQSTRIQRIHFLWLGIRLHKRLTVIIGRQLSPLKLIREPWRYQFNRLHIAPLPPWHHHRLRKHCIETVRFQHIHRPNNSPLGIV